jgi:hypothetical protein
MNRTSFTDKYPPAALEYPCILVTIEDGKLVSEDIMVRDADDRRLGRFMPLDRHYSQVRHLLHFTFHGKVTLDGAILIKLGI